MFPRLPPFAPRPPYAPFERLDQALLNAFFHLDGSAGAWAVEALRRAHFSFGPGHRLFVVHQLNRSFERTLELFLSAYDQFISTRPFRPTSGENLQWGLRIRSTSSAGPAAIDVGFHATDDTLEFEVLAVRDGAPVEAVFRSSDSHRDSAIIIVPWAGLQLVWAAEEDIPLNSPTTGKFHPAWISANLGDLEPEMDSERGWPADATGRWLDARARLVRTSDFVRSLPAIEEDGEGFTAGA